MKNDIPNIPIHIHISDSNLLQYEFHHIAIKFYYKISPWDFKINLRQLLLEDQNLKNFLQPENSSENSALQKIFSKFFWQLYFNQFSNKNQKVRNMLTFKNPKLPDYWQLSDKQYHISQKSNSYEISNTDIYIGEDLEFIIHVNIITGVSN